MRFRIMGWALLASVGLGLQCFASDARQWDEVELLDGRVLSGSVTREGPNYRIRKGHGSTLVPALEVIRLHETKDPLESYEEATARAQNTVDRVRAAKLAESLGLQREAKEVYRRVLASEPDHAQARAALGFVRHQGQWLTHDDHQRALGKVKFRRAWVSVAERKRILEAEAKSRREAAEARWTPAPAGGVGATRTRAVPKTSGGEALRPAKKRKTDSYDRRTPRRVIQLGISTPRRRSRVRPTRGYYPNGYYPNGYYPNGYYPNGYYPNGARLRRSAPRPRPRGNYACPRQAAADRNRARRAAQPRQAVQPQRPRPLAPPRQSLPLGAR